MFLSGVRGKEFKGVRMCPCTRVSREGSHQQNGSVLALKATAESKALRQLKVPNYEDLMQLRISTGNDLKPSVKMPLSGEV